MGPITTVLLAMAGTVGALIFAILVRQGADEFKAWTPHVTSRILEAGLKRLPASRRERMREEIASHLAETPGEIGKWIEVFSFFIRARRMPGTDQVIEEKPVSQTVFLTASPGAGKTNLDLVFGIDSNMGTQKVVFLQAKHHMNKPNDFKNVPY